MKRLIYAEEAKKALTGWDTDPTDEEIEHTIDSIPTVPAIPAVVGKWIVVEEGNFRTVTCSSCGKEYACHYGMLQLQDLDHCPVCASRNTR